MTNRLTTTEHSLLWNTFRHGGPNALGQLYDLFAADLYRYGYNLIRNRQVVEDCLHELFLHLYENRQRLGATDNIRFYLYRALRRRLLDTVGRLNKYDSDAYLFDKAEFIIEPYEKFLIDEQLAEHQKRVVMAGLNNLPKRQKEVLYLVYMKGLTYPQAAEVMAISMKSIYNSVNVALTTLRGFVRKSARQQAALLN
ncbi:RNA polymerase sigma factor [Spirosoma areae]